MAGGIGSRFWPMSRTNFPKQFIDVLGVGSTLIQQTYERFLAICPKENILVVTSEQYKQLVLDQLPEISEKQVLCEPSRRNTAPCIAYASYKIAAENENANVIVAPSDHLVLKQNEFTDIINTALSQIENSDTLCTLSIKPTRPDTGYGYIQFTDLDNVTDERVKRVKTFTEKPDLELAKQFLNSGDFYWNSGIFIWNNKTILKEFEQHLPEINDLFKDGIGIYNTSAEADFIKSTYQDCKNISIDYGIMEKAKSVITVLSDFGWSDLGSWGSLYTHIEHDKNHNAVAGKQIKLYETENSIINISDDRLAVIQGLKEYIVVDTEDVLLICKKKDEQKIKQFVADLKSAKADKFV